MSCDEPPGGGTICRPPQVYGRRVMACPVCERRRRVVVHWMGAYYGQSSTCLGCGDSWMDGEMAPRPFQRGWRQKAIARAKSNWAIALSPDHYRAAVDAELHELFEESA